MAGSLDDALAALPVGGELGDARFFEPRPEFLAAMECFRGLMIYDACCGCGHVAEALRARGHLCLGIDICQRPSQQSVLLENAVTFDYEPGSVVLLCRPCHGPVPSAVVRRAVACGARAVVYVGFPKNRASDLGALAWRFRVAANRVGLQEERMYLLDLR